MAGKPKKSYGTIKSPVATRRLLILFTVLLIAVLGCGGYMGYRAIYDRYFKDSGAPHGAQTEPLTANVLLAVEDKDALYVSLLRFDTQTTQITAAALPDTLAAGQDGRTLRALYEYGGILYLRDALTDALGIAFDRYAVLPAGSAQELVDALGGVEYTVPEAMLQTDKNGTKIVNLPAGVQTLGGGQVLEFLRYTGWDSPQQAAAQRTGLLGALLRKSLEEEAVAQMTKLYQGQVNACETDISLPDITALHSRYPLFAAGKDAVQTVSAALSGDAKKPMLTESGKQALAEAFGLTSQN